MNIASPDRPAQQINPWVVAMSVMLATFMEVLDTSVANVALPHIAGSLSASVDESTWVLTSYLVSNAIVLPLSGWFSSLFGRKRFYLVCVLLFTVSSFACGFAPSLGLLILFRTLQGLGGGSMQPIAQAILVESFPKSKQGMAMAVYGMGVIFAPVIGPTLGGWITDNYTWRWIFLINIPIGGLAFLLAQFFVFDPPYLERQDTRNGIKLDYIGLGLITTGLGFLEVMLDEGQRRDWFGSSLITWSAVLAVCCLAAAVLWELHHKDPIVQLRMLKNRNFALATAMMYLLGFVLYGSTMLMPVLLQTLLGYPALLSGLVLSPGGLLVLVALPIVGFMMNKTQPRFLIVFGLCVSALALYRMTLFNLSIDFRTAMLARCLQMLGTGFLFVPINASAFMFIAKQEVNRGTGLINLARNVGGSAGIATATTLLARRQQFHQLNLVSHLTPLDSAYQSAAAGLTQTLAAQGASVADAAQQSQAMLYGMVQQHAAMLAFIDDFWFMSLVCLAMIPLALTLRRPR